MSEPKKTSDAIKILDGLTGNDENLKALIAEEERKLSDDDWDDDFDDDEDDFYDDDDDWEDDDDEEDGPECGWTCDGEGCGRAP